MTEFTPKVLSQEEFKDILTSKEMDKLVGCTENGFFDAKTAYYNLRDPRDKHEICKDVTAFANNDGGYLLIGATTKKLLNEQTEYIESCDGIVEYPDLNAAMSILTEYIYPNSITKYVGFEKIETAHGKKFLVISISANASDKPFFVKKDPQNREYVSYYMRTHDRGTRFEIEYLHELVRNGANHEKHLSSILGASQKAVENTERLLKMTNKRLNPGTLYDINKDL